MGLAGSRQDEDMFLSMLSPSQKARLLKRRSSPKSFSSSSQQKNALQKRLQSHSPNGKPRAKPNAMLSLIPEGSPTQSRQLQPTFQDSDKKFTKGHQCGTLGHTRTSSPLCSDGLYSDFSFFAFRPAEIAHDFHVLDLHGNGSISRRTLGKALSKQFTRYDVVCTGTLYKLSATLEDFWFVWEYAGFETITCEAYVRICYFLYRLPKVRAFPHLLSYYLYDTNYSQCLSVDAFINAFTALNISAPVIKEKIRDYERSHRTSKKSTFGEEDFIYICSTLKISTKKQQLVDQYISKLQTLDSLPLLITKYKLDPLALAQPSHSTNADSSNCIGAALAYFYSISGTVYDDCTLTVSNLKEFNKLRTKEFISKICDEYQSYIDTINVPRSPLTRVAAAERDKGNEEWSSTSSGSVVEVLDPLFKVTDEDLKVSTLCTPDANSDKPDTIDLESFNTPLGPTMKISLGLDAQDTLSETRSVIYSFEVDINGRLQRINNCDGKKKSCSHKSSAIMGDDLSRRLAMIATVHVPKGYTRETDFEGDNEVIIARSGSFYTYKDADKLQLIAQFHGL